MQVKSRAQKSGYIHLYFLRIFSLLSPFALFPSTNISLYFNTNFIKFQGLILFPAHYPACCSVHRPGLRPLVLPGAGTRHHARFELRGKPALFAVLPARKVRRREHPQNPVSVRQQVDIVAHALRHLRIHQKILQLFVAHLRRSRVRGLRCALGRGLGCVLGRGLGCALGRGLGCALGPGLGCALGCALGRGLGCALGPALERNRNHIAVPALPYAH